MAWDYSEHGLHLRETGKVLLALLLSKVVLLTGFPCVLSIFFIWTKLSLFNLPG